MMVWINDFQMRQNQPSIKIVESELNVQNLDVPMDGNAYYFLKADGTEIYSKFWTKEMKTKINKYVLVNDEVEQNEGPKLEDIIKEYFNDMEGNICSKLDSLDKRLNSFDKVTTKAKPKEEK